MQCNIDARGRVVRRNGGIVCLILAAVATGGAYSGLPRVPLLGVAGFLAALGLFSLFESYKGWCAARAMGIKTRI